MVPLLELCRTTPWNVSYNSFDCVVQLLRLWRTTPWAALCNFLDCVVELIGLSLDCIVPLLELCRTTPWNVSYNSFDCVVQLFGLCRTTPWNVSYNSFDCVVQLFRLCRTTPWNVSYNSFDCVVPLLELCRTTPWNVSYNSFDCVVQLFRLCRTIPWIYVVQLLRLCCRSKRKLTPFEASSPFFLFRLKDAAIVHFLSQFFPLKPRKSYNRRSTTVLSLLRKAHCRRSCCSTLSRAAFGRTGSTDRVTTEAARYGRPKRHLSCPVSRHGHVTHALKMPCTQPTRPGHPPSPSNSR